MNPLDPDVTWALSFVELDTPHETDVLSVVLKYWSRIPKDAPGLEHAYLFPALVASC